MSGDFYSEWRTKDRIASGWHECVQTAVTILGVAAVVVAIIVRISL